MAVSERAFDPPAPLTPAASALLGQLNERRQRARDARRKYESQWSLNKSFLANRQWVGIHPRTGRVIADTDFENRERHTVNVITQYLQTVLGKLYVEDLRPDILFRRDDIESETIATHTQNVAKFIWDVEVNADPILNEMLHIMLTYGTAALRCMYDTTQGRVLGEVPLGPDGQPIMDPAQARYYVAEVMQQGRQVRWQTLRDGQIKWQPLSPFQFLTPPGVDHERDFPWVIVDKLVPVEWARMRYPDKADQIREQEVASIDSLDARDLAAEDGYGQRESKNDIRDHLVVSCMYELPTLDYPQGRVVEWNQAHNLLLDLRPSLPYTLKGKPHHGIVFFHYHRVPGRFLSMGVVEPLIGPQRQKNRARSQMIEMKDRNLGRVYARKGTVTATNRPVGKIMELIEIPLHADYPQETTGVPVGPWIENEARLNDEDMDRVAGLREVSLGTAPAGVEAYAAMALLAEQDERRVGPVLKSLRHGIGEAVLLSLEMARNYWLEGKHMAITGPEGMIEVFNFSRAYLPDEFYIDISKHAPLPTSPAVEAQKIFDIFNAAIAAGQPLPLDWLKDSLDAGRALPIPKREQQVQQAKAEQENLMMAQGLPVLPAYFDDDFIHIEVHRQAQHEAAMVPEAQGYALALEQHIQMHAQNAAMKKPTAQNSVPSQQGPRGIEAQNSSNVNMRGQAQAVSNGGEPQPARGVRPGA